MCRLAQSLFTGPIWGESEAFKGVNPAKSSVKLRYIVFFCRKRFNMRETIKSQNHLGLVQLVTSEKGFGNGRERQDTKKHDFFLVYKNFFVCHESSKLIFETWPKRFTGSDQSKPEMTMGIRNYQRTHLFICNL